jgi:sugar phosphate isomerase/epimerase
MSVFELLRFAIANKIKYVQFGDNMPLHLLSKKELTELKRTADKSGIRLQVGTKGLTIHNIEKYVAIAQTLSSPFIRVVIDDDEYHPDEKEVKQLIRKALPLLKEKQIMLAIENHNRFSAASLQSIILENDPELVGVCLDTANSLGAGEGLNEVLNMLAPYTVNLHIKDIRIQRMSHKMGFIVEGTAAGDGILDIPRIIHELDKTGKCTTATLELWSDPEGTIELTLMKERQKVKKSIRYLKKILT